MRPRMWLSLPALAVAALVLAAAPPSAARTSFWRTDTFEAFEGGTPDGTSIESRGRIVLGPALDRRDIAGAQYAWKAGVGTDGSIYVAAGTPGSLYRLRGGSAELLFDVETADIPALVVTPDGDVFIGTAPGGEVYRISNEGEAELFFDTGEDFVWCMTYSPAHGLIVGTGDAAKVFAVDESGRAEVLHESDDSSIACLAAIGERVLAGTAGEGFLVDVTPGRELAVIFDSRHDEISGIAGGPGGHTYFAGTSVALDDAFDDSGEVGSTFGEGSVYRTTDGGGVVELWYSPETPITSVGGVEGGSVWVGTGSGGRLFSLGADGTRDLVADLGEEEILSIGETRDGRVVTTGGPGALYVVESEVAGVGAYESDVFDSRGVSTWGELRWLAELPRGSSVELRSRSGNTEIPGSAWSEWAAVRGTLEGSVTSPPARFLQWLAKLEGGKSDGGPALVSVEVAYLRENLPPRVGRIVVHSPSRTLVSEAAGYEDESVTQRLPSGVEITYTIDPARAAAAGLPALVRGVRTVEWEALDPNGDRLTFDLWIKGESESEWRVFEERLTRTLHTWDTQSMSDGTYRLKIVASDRPDNPAGTAGSDSRVSGTFIVDNTPPRISDLKISRDGKRLLVRGSVGDALNPVASVEVAVDYGDWEAAFADDGMFDSLGEAFLSETEDVSAGGHTVAVRAIDGAGNLSVLRRTVD